MFCTILPNVRAVSYVPPQPALAARRDEDSELIALAN